MYELVAPDHPLLREVLEPFDFKNPPTDPIELANGLIKTMSAHNGLGLSANQCGLPYRVFVLWSEQPFVCFNPRIIDQTTEQVALEEGCLTFPHLYLKIKRPSVIKVRFQDVTGEVRNEKLIGITSRAFQHEMDHLNGILYQQHAHPVHLQRALNQQKKRARGLKRGDYVLKRQPEISEQILAERDSSQATKQNNINIPTATTIKL